MKHLAFVSLLLVACKGCAAAPEACSAVFSDGSSACDEPVMAEELDGKWCDPTPGRFLCVEFYRDAYHWASDRCSETGDLSGGLEFMPYASSVPTRCFGNGEFYSASVDWTDTGLKLWISGESRPLSLSYVKR